ncbi:MAG: helix-turn-helix transcriptional regulator [Ruminiclostridium sp.]|nr:helix-turn-helix transcriptional regulator [Ruminiclostridium sp.]
MFDSKIDSFVLEIPPWPSFLGGRYRYFMQDEKHITRVCRQFVLLFMLERTLFFTEDGHETMLEEGEWYIQVPGLKQEGRTGSPAPVYYYIHFKASGFPNIKGEAPAVQTPQEDWSYPCHIVMPVRGRFDEKHFRPLFDQLDYLANSSPSNLLGRQAVFLTVFNSLLSSLLCNKVEPRSIAIQIMNYLADNFFKQISCKDLADRFNYTSDYLAQILKEYSGVTPWQYIQKLRLERAKELLSNTDYTLPHIADEVGYNDASVFYKAFRKQMGVAPGEWRYKSRGLS